MAKTYDSKCYELASAFLSDEPTLNTLAARVTLAVLIQETVEGEIIFMRSQINKERA